MQKLFLCLNSLHLLCDSPVHPHEQNSTTATKSEFLLPQKSLHLIFPLISLPFYYCLLFALVPLLVSWLHKAIQTVKHETLQFHSTFTFLLRVVTSALTPDCIHYPIYSWSDDGYFVRDALQNKRYHPAVITWVKKTKQTPTNQTTKKTPHTKTWC